jgi:hypothetical protein
MTEPLNTQVTSASKQLIEIADEFAAQIGRRPSAKELVEILAWGLKSLSTDPVADVRPGDVVELDVKRRKPTDNSELPSSVPELNDSVFVLASDLIVELAAAFKDKSKRRPTLSELLDLLARALSNVSRITGTSPDQIVKIRGVVRKTKKIPVSLGDIIAIPAPNRGNFIAVVLAKNRFGIAYGFFEGAHRMKPYSVNSHPRVEPNPVYSGDEFIQSGRWKIIGHDETLLSLFPSEPEIYHYQHTKDPDPLIGPHGSGETAAGRLRPLTKEEAEDLGLVGEEYRPIYLPSLLEKYLSRKLS